MKKETNYAQTHSLCTMDFKFKLRQPHPVAMTFRTEDLDDWVVGRWMDGWMDGWVGGWVDRWMDG
jgi:hypothetical protein